MHGVIIIQGDKVKFRDNETNKHYLVVGSYNVNQEKTNRVYAKHLDEVEVNKINNYMVRIKFSPI